MNTVPPEALAEALGIPLFRSAWHLPHYRIGATGAWRVGTCPFHLEPGYWSGVWAVAGMPILIRETQEGSWETWMSISPLELESQELPCRLAQGHVVVMGLGMGWIALNVALHPEVTGVTVVERDPEVLDLFQQSGALEGFPPEAGAKLRLVHGDALTYRPRQPVDLLYADIWRDLDEPQTLDQVRTMQAHVQASSVSFWGQEIALARHLGTPLSGLSGDAMRERAEAALGLPLLVPTGNDYGEQIDAVMTQRIARGLHRP